MDNVLTAEELRVLGVLIEKALSTPDYYPLTLNSLMSGCNQKSNREPVVEYKTDVVVRALDDLQRRRLVGRVMGGGSRTMKYRHLLAETWQLPPRSQAVLAPLMLRGPQTAAELRSRTARLHEYENIDAVTNTLEMLAAREPALVVLLARQPGQKEARYSHLLAGSATAISPTVVVADSPPYGPTDGPTDVKEELSNLRDRVKALEEQFEAFKRQFD